MVGYVSVQERVVVEADWWRPKSLQMESRQ